MELQRVNTIHADNVIYLDNNATTMVAPEVVDAMLPCFTDLYGNASSMHTFGGQMGTRIAQARAQVAALIGAQPEEILFTSCGTESDNSAILSAIESQPEKRHFITTRVEHSAIIAMGTYLESKGYEVTWLGVDSQGQINMEELEAAIRKDTALVSIMHANNETGVLFPMEKIARLVKEKGCLFHTDAVQSVGKIPIDLATTPVDFLSLSGHKLHAPKGIGALYIRRGTRFVPFMRGGHQERGRRAGTENVPYIVGLGKACEMAKASITEEAHVSRLRDKLENALLARIPDSIVNGDRQNRLPNTTSIAIRAVEGEALLLMLDRHGICASSGSACTSGSLEPSHVLRAMGVPFTYAHGSLRFSLSRYTKEAEIDSVIEALPPIVEKLRALSPFA